MPAKRETFAPLLLVLASAGIFLLAFGIRTTWLPDVAPVADSERCGQCGDWKRRSC